MSIALSANPYISSSGIVTVYLLLIVFAVLAFLVVVLSVGHKLMQAAGKMRKSKKHVEEAVALPSAPAQVFSNADEEAEVAAITAAITMILQAEAPQKTVKFVVRKIERV